MPVGSRKAILNPIKKYPTWKTAKTPIFIGHRGGSDINAPENTVVEQDIVFPYGVGVEYDVYYAKDAGTQGLVLMHDQTLDRTTTGTGNVYDHYVSELETYDAGVKFDAQFTGEKIPTFQQILDRYGNKRLHLIDCKGAQDRIATTIKNNNLNDYCLCMLPVSLIADASMMHTYNTNVGICIYYDTNSLTNAITDCTTNYVSWVGVDITNTGFNSSFINNAHNAGLKVMTYMIYNQTDAQTAINMGVDALMCRSVLYVNGMLPTKIITPPFSLDLTKTLFTQDWVNGEYVGKPAHISIGNGYLNKSTLNSSAYDFMLYGGAKLPQTGSYQINFTVTPTILDSDSSRFTALMIMQNDKVTSAWTTEYGYGFLLRQNGTIEIDKYPVASPLQTKTGTGNMVVNTPIPISLTITPTSLTMTRTDNNSTVTVTDNTFRGGYLAFMWAAMAAKYSNVTITTV